MKKVIACLPLSAKKVFQSAAFVMYKSSFAFTALLCCGQLAAQNVPDNIDHFLKEMMKYNSIPGMQVAVVKNGKIIKSGAYGLANIPFAVPVTTKTIFPINSATKCFTAVAIMQLVEAGKINPDDVIAKYIHGLPEKWRTITIRQLLTHTSGLPDIVDGDTGKLIAEGDDSVAFAKVKTLPLRFEAGEKSDYNQTNYVLLGQVIDLLAGKPFTEYFRQQQFVPAGMTQTCFGDSYDVIPGMVQPYSFTYNRNGVWKRAAKPMHVFEEFTLNIRAAAGINSTAEELARWFITLIDGKLISKKAMDAMWTPARHNDGSAAPRALGWSVITREAHPAVTGSGGMRCAFYYYPGDDVAVIILTNLRGANPERFIDQVAGYYIPELHPYTGTGLPPAARLMHKELVKTGFNKVSEVYAALRAKDSSFKISEYAVNEWGYILLFTGRVKEAIEVLKLNVQLYPKSANSYDSLGEAYMAAGNKSLAIVNYRRSLDLEPGNMNAKEQLRILEAGSGVH